MNGLILSLFPGIGLLDMAFEEEGYCVVRGPDLLWGGDIRRFHPPAGRFDGVIGGPPCQAFSRLRHLVRANGYREAENLIPEFERCVKEAAPRWFLMENVPEAPTPRVPDYVIQPVTLVDVWVGGETRRRRVFSFGWRAPSGPTFTEAQVAAAHRFHVETLALHRPDPEYPVLASRGCPVPVALGGSGKRKRTAREVATREGAAARGDKTTRYLDLAIRHSGLPPDFLADAPFTVAGKIWVIGSGVPMAMGRAVAHAVARATRG